MQKRVRTICFFMLITLILGCRKESPPIKIGFAGNLTGKNAEVSINARNGFLLAVDEINKKGGIHGRKLEAIIKNDRSDPETAIKIDQELIQENVAAIIGHITGEMCEVALPLINEAKLVMISPIGAVDSFTGIDDYMFRINPPIEETSVATAQLAYKKGIKKMAVVYELSTKSYAEPKYLNFKAAFEALGGEVSVSTFTSGTNVSFPSLAKELTQYESKGYFIIASPLDTAMICQHLRKIDPSGPVFITPWAYRDALLENGGTTIEGLFLVHSFQKNSRDPAFIQFKDNFYNRYKTIPGIWATFSYEAVMVFCQAFSQNPNPEKLKETILDIARFKGLQGDILFDRFGDNRRKSLVLTIKNGEFDELR